LNSYYGKEFERLVIEQLRFKEIELPFSFSEVRRWWHKDKEIDVVVLNEDTKEILFVECKWKTLNEINAEKILAVLKDKSGFVKWNNDMRKAYFGLIAKKVEGKDGLRKKGFVVFDLDDFVS
jgi:AAA+ ATPase superfamily predicted ATPase